MLEAHHFISRFISPVAISRSRYWPRVQPSLEHLELSYLKLFFFQKLRMFQRQMPLTTAHAEN